MVTIQKVQLLPNQIQRTHLKLASNSFKSAQDSPFPPAPCSSPRIQLLTTPIIHVQ